MTASHSELLISTVIQYLLFTLRIRVPFASTSDMRQSLRKGTAHVHVTYRTGNFTNNLNGSNFELEADDQHVTLSIDMSGNQRVRNKSMNSYADVIELEEDIADVKFIQLDKADWMAPFAEAMRDNRYAVWRVEFVFMDGKKHIMPFRLDSDGFNLTFINALDQQTAEEK